MNITILLIRITLAMAYFGVSMKMFIVRQAYVAGWTAITLCLLVLFPVFRVVFKRQQFTTPKAITKDFTRENILRWTRKGIASFFAFTIIGAFQKNEYFIGAMIAAICLLLLSPWEKTVFGPVGLSHQPQSADWRVPVILIARNIGWILYAAGIFLFEEERMEAFNEVMVLLVSGMVGLLARPLIMLTAPYKSAMPSEIYQPVPDTTAEEPQPDMLVTVQPILEPKEALQELKTIYAAVAQLPPQRRGYAFQDFLNQLFTAHGIVARGSFRLTGEEIDGSFDLGPQTYLLEAKWQANLTSQSDLLIFNSKVEGKSTWARGLFISHTGFGADGLQAFAHGKRTSIIGMNGADIQLVLDGHISLEEAIKRKAMKAVENNDFFVPLSALVDERPAI